MDEFEIDSALDNADWLRETPDTMAELEKPDPTEEGQDARKSED